MKTTKRMWNGTFTLLCTGMAIMTSCAPINRFTRIKQVPREYIMNYCGGEIKAPSSLQIKNNPWIVFSDQLGNMSYQTATGKNEMKELQFMDAFLVVGKKGNWLKVIKYDPTQIKSHGRRLGNHKSAIYYGWVHKSDLLLTRSSVTDLATGLKNKQITVFSDTVPLKVPEKYLINDSLLTFKNTDLSKPYTQIPMHQLVFPLKQSEDRSKTLVAKKSFISPDSLDTEICGWVSNAVIKNIGQQLHIDVRSLPDSTLWFKNKAETDTLNFRRAQLVPSRELARIARPLAYSPVTSYCQMDTVIRFKTGAFMPVIDKQENFVVNVNGNRIYYNQFKEIEKDLQKINIVFVVEGNELAVKQFPEVVNIIQGLQPLFANPDDGFDYKFGSVLAFNEKGNNENPKVHLTKDYMQVLNFLSAKSNNAKQLVATGGRSWSTLRTAVNLFKDHKKESNLIILIGETGNNSEWADSTLVNRMAEYNCRILGFQLFGGNPDKFNNFVLQVENMIDNYAVKISRQKREIIVYADQLRKYHEYREVNKNVYCLDFPNRSMTQGWVVFPQKQENLPLEGLASSVDTLLQQVKEDNRLLTQSLYKAFNEIGNFRNREDSTLVDYFQMQPSGIKSLPEALRNAEPEWYLPAQPVVLHDSVSHLLEYRLLVTEAEFKRIRNFINALSQYEVDYKYEAQKKEKEKKRKICDCLEDEVVLKDTRLSVTEMKDSHEYASTKKVRANLFALYYTYINNGKLCRIKYKKLKNMSMAEAQRLITTCPTDNPFLKAFTVNDLKRKKHLVDETLDMLVEYFKSKKSAWEEAAGKGFTSNGQTYYWINKDMLP